MGESVKLLADYLAQSKQKMATLKEPFWGTMKPIAGLFTEDFVEAVHQLLSSETPNDHPAVLCNLLNFFGLVLDFKAAFESINSGPLNEPLKLFEGSLLEERLKPWIGPLTLIVKNRVGVLRKNAAILTAKLVSDPKVKEYSRQFKTIQVLVNLSKVIA